MPIAKASNNGGRYNTVHNQTDDGSVISVLEMANMYLCYFLGLIT